MGLINSQNICMQTQTPQICMFGFKKLTQPNTIKEHMTFFILIIIIITATDNFSTVTELLDRVAWKEPISKEDFKGDKDTDPNNTSILNLPENQDRKTKEKTQKKGSPISKEIQMRD